MAIKPRTYVSAPAFTPLPYGLLSALGSAIRNPTDQHWQAGVVYESICALGDTTYDECFAVSGTGSPGSPVGPPTPKADTTGYTLRGATPFTVYAEMDCSAPGFWDRSIDAINTAFTNSEQLQVERAFWTGLADNQPVVFPHLAANTAVVDELGITLQTAATAIVSGSYDIVDGIGRLEAALAACYDGVGILHVPRIFAAAMADAMLLVNDGVRYRTPSGNIVVFGAGYTGSGPDGTTSGTNQWIYATGAMFIYRSPTYQFGGRDAFDRTKNTLKMIVERNYLIGWDCCHIGVNISTV